MMRIFWHWGFFRDIIYRRVGWQYDLIPNIAKLPGGIEIYLGPLMIIFLKKVR